MRHAGVQAPSALVTLRAYRPAPAQVELIYRPVPGRLLRVALVLLASWGAIPLLVWVPPGYPWVLGAFGAGLFLAYREWHGRYRVHSFAGICPRCGHALSLGVDHTISLPHTLTCFHCHFEPQLEVRFPPAEEPRAEHCAPECPGRWEVRWLADEPYLVCDVCHGGCPATDAAHRAAEEENARGDLLARLTREGRWMV